MMCNKVQPHEPFAYERPERGTVVETKTSPASHMPAAEPLGLAGVGQTASKESAPRSTPTPRPSEHAGQAGGASTAARPEGQGSRPCGPLLGALPPAPQSRQHRPFPRPSRPGAAGTVRAQRARLPALPGRRAVAGLELLPFGQRRQPGKRHQALDVSPQHPTTSVMNTLIDPQKLDQAQRAVSLWWPLMAYANQHRARCKPLFGLIMWITGRVISAQYRLLRIYTLSRF